MTKRTLDALIKKAASGKNKLSELGKPTGTGVVTGASLGAILAALGALRREGSADPDILSNPLLLGALGATGGYLAGNAIDSIPSQRPGGRDTSLLSKGLMAGGVGTFGSMVAADDIEKNLQFAKGKYDKQQNILEQILPKRTKINVSRSGIHNIDLTQFTDTQLRRILSQKGYPANHIDQLIRAFRSGDVTTNYARALREAGRDADAAFLGEEFYPTILGGEKNAPRKLGWKLIDKLRFSRYSPFRWAKALNPFKGGKAARGGETLLRQIARLAKNNKKTTAIAALLAAAGGGKAIYDKVRD